MIRPFHSIACLFTLATFTTLACDDDDPVVAPSRHQEAGAPDGGTPDARAPDSGDADATSPEAGPDATTEAGADAGPATFGGLTVDTAPEDQDIDLFGKPGHKIWIEVSEEQLEKMNAGGGGIGNPRPLDLPAAKQVPLPPAYRIVVVPGDPGDPGKPGDPGGDNGDIYTPGGGADGGGENATYGDHVVVQDVATGSVADYGKMEVELIGESTFRSWTPTTIPNVHGDTDEFQPGLRIGGVEHFRLNNGLVGSIFREHVAHEIVRALGYPGLRSTFAFFGSNVWGEDLWVPMTLIEVYKKKFCGENLEAIGGDCTNMWEFAGDLAQGGLPENACQISECDDTRLIALAEALTINAPGPGFAEAIGEFIDWPRYQRFQCLSWALGTGDDTIHNSNNNLIIEREDGKLVFAPYSIDISAGQDWYVETPLLGLNSLSRGCQADPECWAGTVAACEALLDDLTELGPETLVDDTRDTLRQLGMMRRYDEERAEQIHTWYATRVTVLRPELEKFRYLPDAEGNCPDALVACNDQGCGTPEDCATRLCTPDLMWCESQGACITRGEPCPDCTQEAPFYCPPAAFCVADVDACSAECDRNEPGSAYCPEQGWCSQPEFCRPKGDGGIIIDPGPIRNF